MLPDLTPASWAFLQAGANRKDALFPAEPTPAQGEPGTFKRYHGVPTVALPEVELPDLALGEAMGGRLSCRQFGGAALDLGELAVLLESSYGILGESVGPGGEILERPVPSGGARYPLEVYVSARRIEGLGRGLFHYAPRERLLEQVRGPVPWPSVVRLFLDQPYLAEVDALVIVTGVACRTLTRYGERGFRFLWIEAGHLGQNLALAAAALDLGCLPLAGFYDEPLASLLGVRADVEPPLYAFGVGRPRTEGRAERRNPGG